MARVAKCFQRHHWVVVKRISSTHVRQAGDEVVLDFQNGIHAQITGDAIAKRAYEECTSAHALRP